MSALLYLINSHRLPPEDHRAVRRAIALVTARYYTTATDHQDLHP